MGAANANGNLVAFPYKRQMHVLLYNQDVFDRLNEAYPSDGMSWNDLLELSKRLHVREGDQQITGLHVTGSGLIFEQLSLRYLDQNGKPALHDPLWVKYFNILKAANEFSDIYQPLKLDFVKDKNRAMMTGTMTFFRELYIGDQSPFRWDLASYPIVQEYPDVVPSDLDYFLSINPRGSQKDLSFEVIQYLVSPEFQLENSRKGSASPLNQLEIHQAFGADNPHLKEKNIAALYRYLSQGKLLQNHPYERLVRSHIIDTQKKIKEFMASEGN